jgi:hypothetical protein
MRIGFYAMKMLILTCFSFIIAPALIYCKQVDRLSTIQAWPGEFSMGYYPYVDYMRGNLWGTGGNLVPRYRVRTKDKKIPGDYLTPPTWPNLGTKFCSDDSIFRSEINKYVRDMLNPEFAIPEISSFISNFTSIRGDTSRYEFFGRFINKNQKMSLSGWHNKFSVIGLYLPFDNVKGFLNSANKYLLLPDICVDSIKFTQENGKSFYEYYDKDRLFRLRGFDVLLTDDENKDNSLSTMVIEFTKYYDPEFVP